MNTLKLIRVDSAKNSDEMSEQQATIWSQFIFSKYGLNTDDLHDFFENPENDQNPEADDTIPIAEEIVTRTWTWTSSSGKVYTLVDTFGWMRRYYEGIILVNDEPLIDDNNMELEWIGDPIPAMCQIESLVPEFNLELFTAIRILLSDIAESSFEDQDPDTKTDKLAFNFLKDHPEFVDMEREAKFN